METLHTLFQKDLLARDLFPSPGGVLDRTVNAGSSSMWTGPDKLPGNGRCRRWSHCPPLIVVSLGATPEPEKAVVFQAAFTVRQIEIGLSSVAGFLLGVTFSLYGIALLIDGRVVKWIGAVAIVGGAPTAMAGAVIAYTRFSNLELTINMFSNALLIVWTLVVGVYAWRQPLFSSANGSTEATGRSTSEVQSR